MNTTTLSVTRPGLGWLAGGVTVGLISAALLGPGAGAVQAQTEPEPSETVRLITTVNSISVNGLGRVMAEPDVADVNLGVTKQGDDAKSASDEAANAMDAVVQALIAAGIPEEDIQTTSLNLYPIYDWDDSPPNIEGWEANNLVRVTVRDIDAVGGIVDIATSAGATNVNGISFRIEDPTQAEAVARSEAVASAQAKAEQLATDTGVDIIGVVSVVEGAAQQPPQPFYLERSEAAFDTAAGAAPTPVLPGQIEVSVSVNIQYEIG